MAIPENKVCFPLLRQEHASSAFIRQVWNTLPTREGGYGNFGALLIPVEDTAIVWNGTMCTKHPLPLAIYLIAVTDLGNHPDDRLGGKKKQILDTEVESFLNGVLVESTMLRYPVAYKVGRLIGTLKSLEQGRFLLGRGTQLDLNGQYHNAIIS